VTGSAAGAELAGAPRRRPAIDAVRWLLRNPTIAIGAAIVSVLVLGSVLAPVLAPQDPNVVDLSNAYSTPSPAHPLGTDESGRDLLSRVLYGGRTSLLGPLLAILIATCVGVAVGVAAAWCGGKVEAVSLRAIEMLFAIPGLLLAILLVTMFGKGLAAPVAAIAIAFAPAVAQLVRSAALQEKEQPYIAAYRIQGWSALAVCTRHLIPNILPVILAQAAIQFGYAIMALGAVSYLGFGVQAPTPDWGRMIAEGQDALLRGAELPALAPGVCIVLAVIGFSMLGEGLADRIARRARLA
jgi:peptide/nickel transport system permease protein